MSVAGAITRNKDGAPQWNGESATFNEYEEQCRIYEQSQEYYKRYMVGPRLLSELQGPAKRLVVGRSPDWVSFPGGVQLLLSTLRASLGRPQVSELADFLTKYFKQTRRRSQESMPDYITRKCETYLRAQQALQRVLPHHTSKPAEDHGRMSSWVPSWSRRVSQDSTTSEATGREPVGQPAAPVSETTEANAAEQDVEDGDRTGDDQWRWGGWHTGWSWNGQASWQTSWDRWDSQSSSTWTRTPTHKALVEILPDFVQGWYLLADSGLGVGDKNMIHTAIQGDYSLQRVAQELRSQWDESSLRQRDGHGRTQASYMGEDAEAESDGDYQEGLQVDYLNEAGQALVAEYEDEAQHAMAIIQQGKRTLKEARAKQQQVKLSRQYFRGGPPKGNKPTTWSTPRSSSTTTWKPGQGRDDSQMQCLKCGQIGHRAANCPKKDENHGQAKMADEGDVEQAPFVCYAELALSASTEAAAMTTADAVKRGWCVVDGGATKTIGSITAVQNVLDRNKHDSGDSRLRHVDTKRQPIFSFGNSSENKCASTVELAIQAAEKEGTMTIHTLDAGAGPILMSVSTLRSLGAVIDFEADLICFRRVDPSRIIKAQRSQSGHQLLPLYGNMCEASVTANRAVPSLLLTTATPARSKIKNPTPQRAETKMNIATMKKEQLQELLSQMGEDPPTRWTKVELRQRIVELDPDRAQHQRGQDRDTELRGLIRKINQASKKKQTMVSLCEGELQLALTGNETLAQLERRAVEQAHRLARAHAQDYVGFGKHSGLQYEDINHYQPSYRAWVLQTAQENPGADYRLVRLANWLRDNPPALEAESPVRTARPKAKMMMKPKTVMKEPPTTTIDEDAATSSDGPPIRADQLAKVLNQLSGAIETLQHEMKDLKEEKEERPRKKDAKNMGRAAASDTTSEGYTKVNKDKVVEFPPKAWHETEEWSGERVIISAYSSRAQGHCSTKYLVDALKRRNAKPEVLKLAAEFRCSICEERKKVTPRNLASLEPLPPKFHTVAADIGHWRHPKSGEHHQFMTLIDEGSRFRIAKILSVGAKQQPSGATCIAYLREGWAQIFGNPRTLRLDPAGNFRSEAVSDYCHRHGIFLDLVPGEAHWRIGVCEQAVQGLKMVMDKLAAAEDSISAEEALATAVRILATEDRRNPDGTFRPGSIVWCVRGNQYEDVSANHPSEAEWWRSQAPVEDSDEELIPAEVRTPSSSSRQRPRISEETGECWWAQIKEQAWSESEQTFWQDERASVEVEIEMPHTNREWQRAMGDLSCYMVGAMKRRAVEVREKTLSPEEREQFAAAKAVEVRNFIAAQAFESLPDHVRPSKAQAIGMRWILTWKQREDGSRKAKARAVLLGYQDPAYEHRSTTAPVMSRQSRQMLLQQAANRSWTVHKGDVSGAFLQSREYPSVLHCIPCDEICDAMKVPRGSVSRLKKACYGLVDAPLEWYRSVSEFLAGLGMERTWSDACTWTWRVKGQLRGIISGHVDDFLFAGDSKDVQWQQILQQIKQRFQWGDWEQDEFVQCGVKVEKVKGGFALSQVQYVESLREIPLNASRKRQRQEATSEKEKSQLRATLGSLSWLAQQTSPHLSAEISLLLSEVATSQVLTIIKTNQLVQNVRQRKEHQMLIHAFPEDQELAMFAWVDAGNTNRPDGSSTQGIFVGLGPKAMLRGAIGKVSPMAWHSSKVDRVCRSPGAAEALSAVNGEDALFFARYQWSELEHGISDVRKPREVAKRVIGCLVTDSRNVYDKLHTEVMVVKGAERRTDLELMSLKESQQSTDLIIRWVHSEAQLANSLTKSGGGREMELYYQMQHQWRIVEDDQMRSARKRRQDGLPPLDCEVMLRQRLKYALTYREVKMIVMQRLIKVDSKVRTDMFYPAGFMDMVQIEKTKENFRLLYNTKGRFVLHKVAKEEAQYKLCRVKRVTRGPKGVPYAQTHDGRTIRYPDPDIKSNDTIRLELETGKILDHVKFEVGNTVMISAGNNIGRVGTITSRERHPGSFEIIHIKDSLGHEFNTRLENVFVIGKGNKPWISLPKGNGVKLSIVEDRAQRMSK
ncbi:rps4x [Symbiodinium sp. KB8]|nr:rps4x [Symbiodinium sp. KB8]